MIKYLTALFCFIVVVVVAQQSYQSQPMISGGPPRMSLPNSNTPSSFSGSRLNTETQEMRQSSSKIGSTSGGSSISSWSRRRIDLPNYNSYTAFPGSRLDAIDHALLPSSMKYSHNSKGANFMGQSPGFSTSESPQETNFGLQTPSGSSDYAEKKRS